MQELYSLGITDETLKYMLESFPELSFLTSEEVKEKINILVNIGCNDHHILNILEANPWYLDRTSSDVLSLINKLEILGFTCLNILFDSNPFILNLDVFEIDDYFNDRIAKGEELSDIVYELDSNPFLFDEI